MYFDIHPGKENDRVVQKLFSNFVVQKKFMSTADISKLSISQRLFLLQKIWNSIPVGEISITAAQKKELDKRLARMKRGETKFFRWEEVKANLRKK